MNPGHARPTRPPRREPPLRRPAEAPGGRRPSATRTTAATSRPPCGAVSASRKCRTASAVGRGRDVPVVPGDRRGAALHPRPGPAAARDARRRGGHGRLAVGGGAGRARPVPVLQGLPQRLPGRRGHGHVQGGVPAPPLPGAAAPRRPLRDGPAAGVAAAAAAAVRAGAAQRAGAASARWRRSRSGSAGIAPERTIPELAGETFTRWWRRRRRGRRRGPAGRPGRWRSCGRTPSPTISPRRSAGRRSGSWRRPGCDAPCCRRAAVCAAG